MRQQLSPRVRIRITEKQVFVFAATSFVALTIFLVFFGYFQTAMPTKANATTGETISAGSFIINMGITPQTVGNGLKPYGLVHEMAIVHNVPVKWVIEPTKIRDGNDFVHNGINYRGGTFIIPVQFITPTIAARIAYWQTRGVIGVYSVSDITVPVYMDITSYPRIIVDTLANNDTIIADYFLNAGIDVSNYERGAPSAVSTCHDIWVNPHGDPTWETHYYLRNFVMNLKGYIWSQCHAVSMLEACRNPLDVSQQLNFLTTSGLQCYKTAKCGWLTEFHTATIPTPIAYFNPTDPQTQFIGNIHNASGAGSERWFIPLSTGGWRTTTKRSVTVGTTTSPNEGVVLAYGPAYGDSTNGLVMYQGGHDLTGNGGIDHQVGAQRAFFNFLFLAAKARTPLMASSINSSLSVGTTYNFSVSVTGGQAPYTYHWTSSAGGTFSDTTIANPQFTPPFTGAPITSIVTCVITDNCGRRNFHTQLVSITPAPLPISLLSFEAIPTGREVMVKWITGTEIYNKFFTVQRSKTGADFRDIRIISSQGNSQKAQTYVITDKQPLIGTSYYRLLQTDVSGVITTYGIVKVEMKSGDGRTGDTQVGPNPFTDQLQISMLSSDPGKTIVSIYSVTGKLLRKKEFNTMTGENSIVMDNLTQLLPGTYLVRITKPDGRAESKKMIKK